MDHAGFIGCGVGNRCEIECHRLVFFRKTKGASSLQSVIIVRKGYQQRCFVP